MVAGGSVSAVELPALHARKDAGGPGRQALRYLYRDSLYVVVLEGRDKKAPDTWITTNQLADFLDDGREDGSFRS
jgi:hypothetical protein